MAQADLVLSSGVMTLLCDDPEYDCDFMLLPQVLCTSQLHAT